MKIYSIHRYSFQKKTILQLLVFTETTRQRGSWIFFQLFFYHYFFFGQSIRSHFKYENWIPVHFSRSFKNFQKKNWKKISQKFFKLFLHKSNSVFGNNERGLRNFVPSVLLFAIWGVNPEKVGPKSHQSPNLGVIRPDTIRLPASFLVKI